MIGLDDIGLMTSAVSAVQQVITFGKFLRDVGEAHVIAAHFNWAGERISGDDKIVIEQHPQDGDAAVWWFSVTEIAGYTFVRAPVIESVAIELVATLKDEKNPDARYWRWMAPRIPGVIYGGQNDPPNLKVEFIVVGYRTGALIEHLAAAG